MPPAASRAPASLSARVSLIRLWSPMSPPYFPRTFPCSGAPFPPRGPLGWFPRFTGTVKHSDFLPPFARRFVSFASRYRRCALGFAPAGARRYIHGPGVVYRIPKTGSSTETTGPPRFLEDPTMYMPCSPTPAGPPRSATTALRRCLPRFERCRLPPLHNFEAPSHGLPIRCLRFAGWIAPPPRKTRFRMVGHLFRAGMVTRWVLAKGFSASHPPSPGFSWRTQNLMVEFR
jgi:hypothetical protein